MDPPRRFSTAPSDSSDQPSTTTISTVAVQAGHAKIVLAILKSNEWIRVRIQQMEPDLMEVGATLEEAIALRREHDELLNKLNLKQKDVAELLTRADDLTTQQRSYQQVYEAMAESLGEAWKDLNAQLEYRRMLLDQSINFHQSARQFSGKMEQAQQRFSQLGVAHDVDTARHFLQQHQELKKSILEASMQTLQEGQSLLERIREMGLHADIQNRHATTAACYGIEHLLELLHDRRRHLEELWMQRKLRLEACLQLLLLDQEVEKVSKWYDEVGGAYLDKTDLGENLFAAQMLQEEHIRFEMQAREIQDTVLRLVRTADQLVHSDQYRGGEAVRKRLVLVDEQSEKFMLRLDARRKNLSLAVTFYLLTKTALTKLDEIEQQLTCTDLPRNSAALADLHAYMSGAINEVSAPALRDGRALLERVGRDAPGEQGISVKLDELQERCTKLESMCMARYEVGQKSQAYNQFQDKCNALTTWLGKIGEATLNQYTDMGTNLSTSRDFLEVHERLDEDIRDKMADVSSLSEAARALVAAGSADDNLDQVSALHQQWNKLHEIVGRRIKLAFTYVTFHKKAQQLAIEMDALEQYLKIEKMDPSHISDTSISHKEEKYATMDDSFRTVEAKGKLFIKEAEDRTTDSHLDTRRAVSIVETIISQFLERRYLITEYYEHWKVHVSTGREFHTQWQKFIQDARKTIDWMMSAEKEFFLPNIAGNLGKTIADAQALRKKLEDFGPVAKKAQEEIEAHLKQAELLALKGDTKGEKEQIVGELLKVHTRFQARISEYQLLLNMTHKFFENLQQLDRLIEDTEKEYDSTPLPSDVTRAEVMLHEHEMNRNQMRQLINLSNEEGEQIVVRVRQQDSEAYAKDGVQNVLSLTEGRRMQWEKAWDEQKARLEQNVQVCQFYYDLRQIHSELDELQRQVNARRGSYGHSLSSVVMTSQAFKNFEETVELIEANVRRFISTADVMLRDEHCDSRRIRTEVDDVQTKWSRFYATIHDYRAALDASKLFFETMDQCEASITESSKFLLQIGQKATDCKTADDAGRLVASLESFKSEFSQTQEVRLSEMSRITVSMYGPNQGPQKMQHIVDKNVDMLTSFTRAVDEVSVLKENLIKKEQILDEMNKVVETPHQPCFVQPLQNAEINEGNRFTFECRIQCDESAAPRIEWFKDDVPLKSPDYEMSYRDDGTCKLTIDETFCEDTARYTCKARTDSGSTHTSAQLRVKELKQHTAIPPAFTKHLKSLDLAEGTQMMFECHVSGVPTPAVSWHRGDECIDNAPDYVITKINGMCCLKIRKVAPENSARYTCRATNGGGEAASSATLNVIAVKKPYFHEPLKEVIAKEGSSAKLECSFSADPAPQIVWLRNDQPIQPSPAFRVVVESTYTTLTIREVYAEHVGTYVVVARNVGGETRTSCQLTVAGLHSSRRDAQPVAAPAPATAAAPVATGPAAVTPCFTQPLQNKDVTEGKKARLDCIIVGQPEPEVIWFHNDRPVKESLDFQLLFEGDRCSLVIREVYLEDSGDYRCLARNKHGMAESRARLVVEALSELSDASATAIATDGVAPKFTQLLKDIEASEGEKVRFDCRVIGHPTPQVKWYRGRQQITNSSDFLIACERELHSLSVPEAFAEDAGNYMVRATNDAGQAKCYATLMVRASHDTHMMKTRLVEMSHSRSGSTTGESPEFQRLFRDMRVRPGQACEFEVVITGRPRPKVHWLFNNEPIVSPDYQISSSGDTYRLRIPEVFDEDAGRFSITAENECGKATCAALLVVVTEQADMPDEGSPPETPLTRGTFFKAPVGPSPLAAPAPAPAPPPPAQKPFQPVPAVARPAPVAAPVLARPVAQRPLFQAPAAVVRPVPAPAPVMTRAAVPQALAAARPVAAPPSPRAPFAVRQPSSVRPQPAVAPAPTPTPTLAPVSLTMTLPVPPQFLTSLRNLVAQEGTKVTFAGCVAGRPRPTVRWHRAGAELTDSPDFEIAYTEDGRVSLSIPEAFEEDSGQYTVTAQNTAGSVNSSAELIVKAALVPPEFVERLQTREVREGAPVTFTVRVRGTPPPTVTWYREGAHIVSSPDFEITQSGDAHALAIPEVFYEDAGKFTAKADSAAGHAACTAELIVEVPSGVEGSVSPSPPMSRSPSIGMSPDRAALYRPVRAPGSSREPTPQKAPPQFTKALQDRRARQGERVALECSVPLFPAPERVVWARDDAPIRDSPDYAVTCRNGVCSLVIVEVFPEDSGRFTCTVTINGATNVTAMYLTVEPAGPTPPAPAPPPPPMAAVPAPLSMRPPPPPSCAPTFESRLVGQLLRFGETAHFECRVRGEPAPEILWTRRGSPLVDKKRYKSTYDQYKGLTTLTILNTCQEDEGEYTCTAVNALGESSTSGSLLTPDVPAMGLRSPQAPKSPVVTELEVRADKARPAAPVYRRVSTDQLDRRLSEPTEPRRGSFQVSSFEKRLMMEIGLRDRNAPPPSQPQPQPALPTTRPSQVTPASVSAPRDDARPPVFEQRLKNFQLMEGSDVTFVCKVNGSPTPHIEWFLEGRPLQPSSRQQMAHTDDGYVSLRLRVAFAEDAGHYTCCATNAAGRDACSARLMPAGGAPAPGAGRIAPEPAGAVDSTSYVEPEALDRMMKSPTGSRRGSQEPGGVTETHYRPRFRRVAADRDAAEGEMTRFDALVSGRPMPELLWYRDGAAVRDDRLHKVVINEDGVHSLIIHAVSADDAGLYTCIARNKAGEDTFQVRLNVQRRTAACAPRFTERMSNVSVREGEPVALCVRADGAPTPMISWQKDGRMLSASYDSRYRVETTDGASRLTIESAAPTDAAWYQCSAVNVAGTASNRARLIVQVEARPPSPERKLFIPRRTTPTPTREIVAPTPLRPAFEPPKPAVAAPSGPVMTPVAMARPTQLPTQRPPAPSSAEIVLSPTGVAAAAVPWRPVKAPAPAMQQDFAPPPTVQPAPQTVRAYVPPSPVEPLAPVAPPAVSRTQLPAMAAPQPATSKRTPPTPPPRPTVVTVKQWTPESEPAIGVEETTPIQKDVPRMPKLLLPRQHIAAEYEKRVISQPAVQRPSTVELIENGIEPTPVQDDMFIKESGRPPVFTSPLRPLRQLVESQPAHFECRLVPIGDPDMQVEWFKDGQVLRAGHRFKTTNDFGYVALDILYTYPEDNGTYMCRATNKSGTAENTTDLHCRGKRSVITETQLPEGVDSIQQLEAMEDAIHREPATRDSEEQVPPAPPVFDLLPEALQVEEGDTAKFMVKISGHPRPRLTWWVNGAMIVNSQRFRIWYDGMIHLLEIPKVREYDAGTIRVVAKNPMGEAVCSSALTVIPQEDWRSRLRQAPKSASQVEAEKIKPISLESTELKQAFMKPKTTVVEIRAFERASQHKVKSLHEQQLLHGADTIIQRHVELAKCDPSRELREHEPTVRIESEQHMERARAMLSEHHVAPPAAPPRTAPAQQAAPKFVALLSDIVANEGSAVKLEVQYIGMPVPKVQWYREGIEIQPSRDFQTTTLPDRSFLYIPEVFPEDTGCFSVRATNPYGTVTCSARLTVNEDTSIEPKEASPEFVVQMHDITINVGEPATFDCQITGQPRPEVYWAKNGVRMTEDARWKFIIEGDHFTLLIYESIEEMNGFYECVAVNKMGKATCRSQLDVQGKPSRVSPVDMTDAAHQPPQLIDQLHDQHVKEGEQAVFKCCITATPEPLVQWYYGDQPIKPSKYFQMCSEQREHSLVIAGAFPEDEGVYKCIARNQSGEVTCIAHLSVTPVASAEPEPLQMAPPQFTRPIGAVDAAEGSEVRFEAVVTEDTTVCWLRENIQIQPSEEFQILQEDNRCLLLIKAVFPEDSGTFTCRATNAAGIAECSAELLVEAKTTMTKKPPQIKKAPSPVREVVAGNSTKLVVQLDAFPPPLFNWYVNGARIATSQRLKISYENGVVTLVIFDARPEDSGEYTLRVSNELGETNCTTVLNICPSRRVVELPLASQEVTMTSQTVRTVEYTEEVTPMFKTPLKPETRITENSLARLECEVQAYPPPVISWHVNGVEIRPSAKYRMELDGERSVLLISNVTSDDTGVYTCRAVSDIGEAVSSTTLYVTVAEHQVEPPAFSLQLQPVSATDGREVVLACVVTGRPAADVHWYHNEQNIDESDDFVITYDRATGRTELVIVDCLPDDQGVFKCVARNSGGQAMTQCILTVTPDRPAAPQQVSSDVTVTSHKTEVVTATEKMTTAATTAKTTVIKKTVKRQSGQPPRFVKPIQPQVVREGESAEFIAGVTGAPLPDITWLKDKVEVKSSERYTMHFDRDTGACSLTIRFCEPLDVGVFSCRASNIAGKATCTANIVVVPPDAEVTITEKTVSVKKEKITVIGTQETRVVESSPTFSQPLLPHTEVVEGENLTLECRAVSEPDATFVWYRSGLEITPTQRTQVLSERGVSSLTLTQVVLEDSGEYVCTARNALGEASTRTMLLVKRREITQTKQTIVITAGPPSDRPLVNGVPLQMTPMDGVTEPAAPPPSGGSTEVTTVTSSWRQEETLIRHQREYFSAAADSGDEEAPSFVMPLTNQRVADGDRASFRVLLRGLPAPSVTWFYNSRPLTNSSDFQVKIDIAKGESTLVIVEVFPDDEGDYMCRAENMYGTAITHCHLFVKLPSSSSDDEAYEQAARSETVEVVKTERPANVRETRRFSETIAIDHHARLAPLPALPAKVPARPQRAELRVRQESVPRGMRLNVETHSVQLVRKAEAAPTHRQQVNVAITKQRRYSETIAIDLSRRSSLKTAQRHLQTLTVQRRVPDVRPAPLHRQEVRLSLDGGSSPRFLTELVAAKVMDGDEVRLTCRVVSSPMPDVAWYHNGKRVEDNPDFRTAYSRDTGDVQLHIMEVFPQDTGTYDCVATNCHGRAVTSTTVIVEAYEYVADSEEATASQTESLMSASSMDEAEFQQKTKRFLANMQVLRQEDNGMVSPLYRDEVVDELEIEEHGYEETIQMADVKWQVQKRAAMTVLPRETEERTEESMTLVTTEWPSAMDTPLRTDVASRTTPTESRVEAVVDRQSPEETGELSSGTEEEETQEEEITIILAQPVITPKTVSHVGMVTDDSEAETAGPTAEREEEETGRGEDVEVEMAVPAVAPRRESHVEPVQDVEQLEAAAVLESDAEETTPEQMEEAVELAEPAVSDRTQTRVETQQAVVEVEMLVDIAASETETTKEEVEQWEMATSTTEAVRESHIDVQSESLAVEVADVIVDDVRTEKTDAEDVELRMELPSTSEATASMVAPSDEAVEVEIALEMTAPEEVESAETETDEVAMSAADLARREAQHVDLVLEEEAPEEEESLEAVAAEVAPSSELLAAELALVESKRQESLVSALEGDATVEDVQADIASPDVEETTLSIVEALSAADSAQQVALVQPVEEGGVRPEVVSEDGPNGPRRETSAAASLVDATYEAVDSSRTETLVQEQSTAVAVTDVADAMPTPTLQRIAGEMAERIVDEVTLAQTAVEPAGATSDVVPALEAVAATSMMAPVFRIPLSDVTVGDGDRALLECHVAGNPRPSVEWFVERQPIRASLDFQMTYEAGVCMLLVTDVLPEDEGEYSVRAVNDAGTCVSTAYLTVLPSSGSDGESVERVSRTSSRASLQLEMVKTAEVTEERTTFEIDLALQVMKEATAAVPEGPKFVRPLENKEIYETLPVTLECQVTGFPQPDITWYQDGKRLVSCDRMLLSYAADGAARLHIERATLEDEAEYMCEARNDAGLATSLAELLVEKLLSTGERVVLEEYYEIEISMAFKWTVAVAVAAAGAAAPTNPLLLARLSNPDLRPPSTPPGADARS